MAAVAQTLAQVLQQAGASKAGAAGVIGNFQQESSLNPSSPGGLLGQWQGSRLTALQQFAQAKGQPVTNPAVQAQFAVHEMQTQYPGLWNMLRTTSNPQQAALAVSQQYERPGIPDNANRENYAAQAFKGIGGTGATTGSALPAAPGMSVPVTTQSFDQAGFNQAQAKYIAGTAVNEASGSANPYNTSPGATKGFAQSLAGTNPLLATGQLTTTAPNPQDFMVAQTHLQQLAGNTPLVPHAAAGVTLTGLKTSPGPVANTVVPAASWNPSGKPIATWIVPVLEWAAAHGWKGTVNSGYRSLQQQQSINASGAFSAPAGKSNHEFAAYPGGAVDVTDPTQLEQVLKAYNGPQRLVGGVLGPVDPEHFSANGH